MSPACTGCITPIGGSTAAHEESFAARAGVVPKDRDRFNELVVQPRRLVSALGAAFRNDNVRRVELAWGAAIAAEWAHFVALGVFASERGGPARSASRGWSGCCRQRPSHPSPLRSATG